MSERTLSLARRRNELRAQCAVQRSQLTATAEQIEARLGVVRRLAGRPLLILGGVVLLAMIGPRRMIRWAGRGAVLFTSGQRVLRLLR